MTSRREFTKDISIGSIGPLALGTASCVDKNKQTGPVIQPSDKVNLAFVGISGKGAHNLSMLKDQNIVALCDVDWGELQQKSFDAYPKAKRHRDFRKMMPIKMKKCKDPAYEAYVNRNKAGEIENFTEMQRKKAKSNKSNVNF